MKVSLVCTVLNEETTITLLLDSIISQSRQPDEVIIVDGGSRDGTLETLRSYEARLPLQVLIEPGCNISKGRNRAIQAASGQVIACTDAGVMLDRGWLAALVAPFEQPSPPDVACGFFQADPANVFEVALGATVLPELDEIRPASFLPSSRSVAYTREAWQAAGGYPEWLDYCEDLVFDLRLRELRCCFAWAPGAIAHFRPRPSIRAFFRQYYRYARGDGKADLWRKRHAVRYLTYVLGLAGAAAGFWQPWIWLLLAAGAAVYVQRPYRRLWRRGVKLSRSQQLGAVLWVPAILATGDIAKMAGYPVGVWWRYRNR